MEGDSRSRYLQVDETPIKLLRPKTRLFMDLFCPACGKRLGRHRASATRSGDIAKKEMQSFNGLLQTDGYNGYKACVLAKALCPAAASPLPDVSQRGLNGER